MGDRLVLTRGALSLLLWGLALWLVFRYGLATAEPEAFFLVVTCPPLIVAAWLIWPPRVY